MSTPIYHTDGPWVLDDWIVCAEAAEHPEHNAMGAICSVIHSSGDTRVDHANGKLIAAAPDMKRALKRIIESAGYAHSSNIKAIAEDVLYGLD